MSDLSGFLMEHALMRQVLGNLLEYLEDQGLFDEYSCTAGEGEICIMNAQAPDSALDLCYSHQIYMDCKNLLDDMDMREGAIQ